MSKRCKGCKLQPCASWCSRGKPRVVDGHSAQHEALRQAIRDEAIARLRAQYEQEQWAESARILAAAETAADRIMERKAARERAAEAESPAGWHREDMLGAECFRHSTGVCVWLGATWYYNTVRYGSGKIAPTRDEAMARALEWEPASFPPGSWTDGLGSLAMRADLSWSTYRPEPDGSQIFRSGFRSLPHAIAWCRGDA